MIERVNLHVLAGRHVYLARLVAAALVLPILLLGGLVGLDYWVLEPSLPSVVSHAALLAAGVGYDPASSVGGLGLRNMRERAFNAGGRLVLISKPGAGTRLQMRIPVRMGVVA